MARAYDQLHSEAEAVLAGLPCSYTVDILHHKCWADSGAPDGWSLLLSQGCVRSAAGTGAHAASRKYAKGTKEGEPSPLVPSSEGELGSGGIQGDR